MLLVHTAEMDLPSTTERSEEQHHTATSVEDSVLENELQDRTPPHDVHSITTDFISRNEADEMKQGILSPSSSDIFQN